MVEPSDYKDRLAAAIKHAKTTEAELAKHLGFTYTGMKKALKGGDKGTSAMTAANNAKAAAFCKVNPDWLATGNGRMVREDAWPFEMVERARFDSLPPAQQAYIQGALANAIAEAEKSAEELQASKSGTRR